MSVWLCVDIRFVSVLQVGNIGMTWIEQSTFSVAPSCVTPWVSLYFLRTTGSHFSLWVFMASPLLIGADVTMLTNESLDILANPEVTAINQDKLGVQGVPVGPSTDTQSCWTKPLANGDVAVMLLNTGDASATVSCTLAQLKVTGKVTAVRDLLNRKPASVPSGDTLSAQLDSHDHQFLRLTTA